MPALRKLPRKTPQPGRLMAVTACQDRHETPGRNSDGRRGLNPQPGASFRRSALRLLRRRPDGVGAAVYVEDFASGCAG